MGRYLFTSCKRRASVMKTILTIVLLMVLVEAFLNFGRASSQSESDTAKLCNDLRGVKFASIESCWRYWSTSNYFADTSNSCQTCSSTIRTQLATLAGNYDEASVRRSLSEICNRITDDSTKTECVALVDHYLNVVKDLITQNVDGWTVCGLLKMCRKSVKQIDGKPIPGQQSLSAAGSDSSACANCKSFVGKTQSQIESAALQTDALQKAIYYEICLKLSAADDMAMCNGLVSAVVPKLLKIAAESLNPAEDVCQAADLCLTSAGQSQSHASADSYSLLCGRIAYRIHQIEADMQQTIQSEVCSKLPTDLKITWDIDRVSSLFYNELFNAINFGASCQDAIRRSQAGIEFANNKLGNSFCATCAWIVNQLTQLIASSDSTDVKVESQVIEKLCQSLPPQIGTPADCAELRRRAMLNWSSKDPNTCLRVGCTS